METPLDPHKAEKLEAEKLEANDKIFWRIRTIVSVTGLILAIVGCLCAYYIPESQLLLIINTVIWTFAPPVWFIVEYSHLFPKLGNPNGGKDDLKYGQSLATRFWAGIGVLLTVIYKTRGCL